MARRVYTYEPYNTIPDKTIGIKLPFNKDAGGSKSVSANYAAAASNANGVFTLSNSIQDQAFSNLKNLLLTIKGERIFQPEFGTDIRKSLFENNTEFLEIGLEESLREDIARWLPYIQIVEFDIERDVDSYTMLIRFVYRVTDSGANQEIVIFATPENISIAETADEVDTTIQQSNLGGGY